MTATALINIDVDDLERATAFYMAAFGLTIGRKLGPAITELLGASAPIYLLEKAAGSAAGPATDDCRRYARHWTPVHLDFVVADSTRPSTAAVAAGATWKSRRPRMPGVGLPTLPTRSGMGCASCSFWAGAMMKSRPAEREEPGLPMDWLIGELVMLAGPAYFFLQVLMAVRYRGRWLGPSLVPLLLWRPWPFMRAWRLPQVRTCGPCC